MTGDVPGSLRHSPDSSDGQAEPAAPKVPGERIILDQTLDAGSLYQLRASVAAHAIQAGLSQRRADDLVIAAHELAANVVRHGSGHGRLRIWRQGETLNCQVTDEGYPQDLADSPDWQIERGHGLWLVRQLADQTILHPGLSGSAVTITFALGSPRSSQPFSLTEFSADDGSTAIVVTGHLDLTSADEVIAAVESVLAKTPAARVVIDLAGLISWDAFGLARILRVQSRTDASLSLTNMPAELTRHLRETGLADRFS